MVNIVEISGDNLSVAVDLDEANINPDMLIKNLCASCNLDLIEWSQFTNCAIGKMTFDNEVIKIVWEDFPNSISKFNFQIQ